MDTGVSRQLEQRLADVDRRLRHLAGLLRPVAFPEVGADESGLELEGDPGLPTDQLLERIERATAALEASTDRDAAELVIMRALLADVSLVTAAFRRAAAVSGRRLDEATANAARARPTTVDRRETGRGVTS